MPLPLAAIAGAGMVGMSLYGLIKNLVNANTSVSPEELAGEIDRRAMAMNQQTGLPIEQAKAAIAEATKADLEKDHTFDWGSAIGDVLLGVFPALGLAKAAKAGMGAGVGAFEGMKALSLGGLGGASTDVSGVAGARSAFVPKPAAVVPKPPATAAPAPEPPKSVYGSQDEAASAYRDTEPDFPSVDEMLGAAPAKTKAKRGPRKVAPGVTLPSPAAGPGDLTPAELAEAQSTFARMKSAMPAAAEAPAAPTADALIQAAMALDAPAPSTVQGFDTLRAALAAHRRSGGV